MDKGTDQYVLIWCVQRADGMDPPFASAADVLTVTATELVIDNVGSSRITTMSGVGIYKYSLKERVGRADENRTLRNFITDVSR